MAKNFRIALAQLDFLVGDIQGNLEKHFKAANIAREQMKADMIVFPELSLIGYSAEDLLLRPSFIKDVDAALQKFISEMKGIYCLIGHPYADHKGLFNGCSLIYDGKVLARYAKQTLPNYGVFDEDRYFIRGDKTCIVHIHDVPIALMICEDLWKLKPSYDAAQEGARLILSPNASPFEVDKYEQRVSVLSKRAKLHHLPIVYVNHVSGQDELVFDGGSLVMDANGEVLQCAGFFQEKIHPVDLEFDHSIKIKKSSFTVPNKLERIYQALVLGLKDYVEKNHFQGVVLGISGGIDSALTLALATDALGKERVRALIMPSRFTASISMEDAMTVTTNLGVHTETISIEEAYKSTLDSLSKSFRGKKNDVTEENIQARCRAILLMAYSNKFGHMVLSTGNRSEIAVGYCTLYGDMVGGFAPLKDVPKTMVYELARYRNEISPVIPERTISRAPTAELAPDQKDEDSLPPYPILDKLLECYLNHSMGIQEIISQGYDAETVKKVVHLIKKNEYKRHQAVIGPHINHKSFGKDWRYPITNGYKG